MDDLYGEVAGWPIFLLVYERRTALSGDFRNNTVIPVEFNLS